MAAPAIGSACQGELKAATSPPSDVWTSPAISVAIMAIATLPRIGQTKYRRPTRCQRGSRRQSRQRAAQHLTQGDSNAQKVAANVGRIMTGPPTERSKDTAVKGSQRASCRALQLRIRLGPTAKYAAITPPPHIRATLTVTARLKRLPTPGDDGKYATNVAEAKIACFEWVS